MLYYDTDYKTSCFYKMGIHQRSSQIKLWCFVASASHHVLACYQYEASCKRANEQPSRDANRARFQKLLVNAHISTKRRRSSCPPPALLFGQWLSVNTEIGTTCLFLLKDESEMISNQSGRTKGIKFSRPSCWSMRATLPLLLIHSWRLHWNDDPLI